MERCPCCAKEQGTCDCHIEWLAASNGDRYEWCATHHRTIVAELIPEGEFEEQVEDT